MFGCEVFDVLHQKSGELVRPGWPSAKLSLTPSVYTERLYQTPVAFVEIESERSSTRASLRQAFSQILRVHYHLHEIEGVLKYRSRFERDLAPSSWIIFAVGFLCDASERGQIQAIVIVVGCI
jgi:hypothetical protein